MFYVYLSTILKSIFLDLKFIAHGTAFIFLKRCQSTGAVSVYGGTGLSKCYQDFNDA